MSCEDCTKEIGKACEDCINRLMAQYMTSEGLRQIGVEAVRFLKPESLDGFRSVLKGYTNHNGWSGSYTILKLLAIKAVRAGSTIQAVLDEIKRSHSADSILC